MEICPFEELGCKFLHAKSSNKIDQPKKVNDTTWGEEDEKTENSDDKHYTSFHTSTSTPIKIEFKCEECKDKSQCTDCFVRQDWAIAHDRVEKVAF